MGYYIDSSQVEESIQYFKDLGIDKDDSLFIYLMAKRQGISVNFPITFKVGNLTENQKAENLKTLWMFGGLFDSTESAGKHAIMFPSGFGSVSLFQSGSETHQVPSRIKDTVEKKNINVEIYKNDDSYLKLKPNYSDIISENYLNDKKISLSHLATWLFRFTEFDFPEQPTVHEFTKVIHKAIFKFLKINKRDMLWLFEDDLLIRKIEARSVGITGQAIRSLFDFKNDPIITRKKQDEDFQTSSIDEETITKFLSMDGDNPSKEDILKILESKKQIVLTGVPGVGKSRYTNIIKNDDMFEDFEMVQFHANYSYEDFIGGETLKVKDGATSVDIKTGIFLDFVKKVEEANTEAPQKKYLFIIDELNRGNIAEIFGETILTLDRGYSVKLSRNLLADNQFSIPDNVYIIGTMNTSDRNIAFLDLAIRRRFAFVNLVPNYEFLSESVSVANEDIDLGHVLRIINQRILSTLQDAELLLGQSYFIPNPNVNNEFLWTMDELKNQFNFVLLPTIREYSFNDNSIIESIIGEQLSDGIQDLEDFKVAFGNEFSLGN